MKTDKIYLVGFMAAGKSTLATRLAERLGWEAQDIDELIEARERCSVAEIFVRQGEPYFRILEREILTLLLPLRRVVVATGGGTYADPDNRRIISLDGVSVWLDTTFGRVLERMPLDGRRPLAKDRGQLERLFVLRQEAYQHADLRLDAHAVTPDELADQVVGWLETL